MHSYNRVRVFVFLTRMMVMTNISGNDFSKDIQAIQARTNALQRIEGAIITQINTGKKSLVRTDNQGKVETKTYTRFQAFWKLNRPYQRGKYQSLESGRARLVVELNDKVDVLVQKMPNRPLAREEIEQFRTAIHLIDSVIKANESMSKNLGKKFQDTDSLRETLRWLKHHVGIQEVRLSLQTDDPNLEPINAANISPKASVDGVLNAANDYSKRLDKLEDAARLSPRLAGKEIERDSKIEETIQARNIVEKRIVNLFTEKLETVRKTVKEDSMVSRHQFLTDLNEWEASINKNPHYCDALKESLREAIARVRTPGNF